MSKRTIRNILYGLVIIILGFSLFLKYTEGATVLFPYQGGTGKGTATAGDVGKFLQISDDSPFTYSFGAAGTGSVTSVSVTTANGISGTVATATTTPAISLDISGLNATKIADGSVSSTEFQYLDGVTSAIQTQLSGKVTSVSGTTNRITSTGGTTPVLDISATFEALLGKVANSLAQFASTTSLELKTLISDETGSGALVFATSPVFTTPNIGSATGSISGNAGTSTALAVGRTISISGDLTYTSPSFDGSGNVTAVGTLATVNGNVGSFGSSTSIPSFTVNAKGLITAASGNAVIAPAGTLTGTTLASNVVTSSLTTIGTLVAGAVPFSLVTGLDSDLATFSLPASTTISAFGATLVDDADASTARTTLGLVIGTNVQAWDAQLDTWATVTPSANGQSLVSAANYAAMKALLDLEIGTDVQAWSANLDEYSAVNPTTAGLALLDDADASAQRTTLGLVIGTNVQAYDADLTTWAGITPGTGVGTALAVNVGSAGAFVTFNGALGTPSSGVATNITGLPAASVLAGTFGAGAYVMDTSLTIPKIIGGVATTSDLFLQTTSGVGASGADMHFLVGNNGGTEAITILNSGFVGIGTTGPLALLHVQGVSAAAGVIVSRVENTTSTGFTEVQVRNDGGTNNDRVQFGIGGTATGDVFQNKGYFSSALNIDGLILRAQKSTAGIQFLTGGSTERMRIDSVGNVGIGTTSPTAVLHLKAGTTAASTAPLKFTTGTLNTTAEIGTHEYNNDHHLTNWKLVRYSVGGTINESFADVSVGGAEADIFTFTTIANTLGTNGDKVIASYSGNFVTVGTELTQLKVYFAGTAIWDSTGIAVATGTSSWSVDVKIIRVSSTVVRYIVTLNTSGASGFVYATSGELTGLTLSGTNIIKITGTSSGVGSGAGDIVGKMGFLEFKPAT